MRKKMSKKQYSNLYEDRGAGLFAANFDLLRQTASTSIDNRLYLGPSACCLGN
jgi:hypothetical protein